MLVRIDKSSVNYFILSFLPPLQIVRMGQLNHRFYDLYVPVTLGTVTIDGTIPSSNKSQFVFALRFEQSPNLSMLVFPRSRSDSSYQPRKAFWDSLAWTTKYKQTKYKRSKKIGKLAKTFDYGMASWSQCVSFEFFGNVNGRRELQSYLYVMGGMSIEKRLVLDQHLEVNVTRGFVVKKPSMPLPRWAHAATLCGSEIVVTGGTAELMLNMGMRSVPIG